MRTLVVEHDPLSTAERVGAHLERRGARLEPFVVVEDIGDPSAGNVFPDDDYDLVVLMGSPWSVYEDRVQGWVQPELSFIRRRVEAGGPLLGICFGAQVMSSALGGSVRYAARPEYGWTEITPSTNHIASGPWFQFHHDEFTLPPGSLELARNESGVQAFRTGRALATQFHPEMTGDLLASWCDLEDGAKELVDAGHDPGRLIEESRLLEIASQPALEQMLDWFLDDVAGKDVAVTRVATPQGSAQVAG
ncbi:MAG TPA: type 1 glutamine amidotransferase [Acidimicrobiia bacterium]|nr:type 1 glutamine amidotransferase [Acidimicrobiia bacterium]